MLCHHHFGAALARRDLTDCAVVDAKFPSNAIQRPAICRQTLNSDHGFDLEPRISAAKTRSMATAIIGVCDRGIVPQVLQSVVRWITIVVAPLHAFWTLALERKQNEKVNIVVSGRTVLSEANSPPAIRSCGRRHEQSRSPIGRSPRSINEAGKDTNSAEVANLIKALVPRYGSP